VSEPVDRTEFVLAEMHQDYDALRFADAGRLEMSIRRAAQIVCEGDYWPGEIIVVPFRPSPTFMLNDPEHHAPRYVEVRIPRLSMDANPEAILATENEIRRQLEML